jgi:Flp pilus assembly protein TadG
MSIGSWYSRAYRELGRFGRAQKGNVALTFAFATLPLIGFVGAAIDYSQANSVKSAMQLALDSTALMLSKEAATDTADQLTANAQKYFAALFNRPEAQNILINASYTTTGGSTVVINGSVAVPTTFMAVLGYKSIGINSSSTAKWGSARLRVALVLDNTGSMAQDGKMAALKSATHSLLDQLKAAAGTDGDVYVSLVPFVKDVNVGAANYDASWDNWIDWSNLAPAGSMPDSTVGPGSSCPYSSGWGGSGYSCVNKPAGTTTISTIPSSGATKGYICPSNSIGCYDSTAATTTSTKTVGTGWFASCGYLSNCSCTGSGSSKVCTQTTTVTGYTHKWFVDATKWNGCVTDRGSSTAPGTTAGNDQTVTNPTTSDPTTLFPAEQYSACPQAMMGLSYNWTAMSTLVDNMTPNGSTNQPIGLVWGWQSLVGGGPFVAPPLDPYSTYAQVIILLSDGLNTQDRWYGDGTTTNTSVDSRMYDSSGNGTCANIKATGITIYTIHVNTGGDPMSTLLRNCASSPDKFWMVTASNGLGTVFNTIATNLTHLRVAK